MIIGIVGKMQSGKDTVGKIIQMLTDNLLEGIPEEAVEDCVLNTPILNPSFKIVKFADKLKDMVCLLIGCTRADLEDDSFKDTELGEEWWYYKDKETGIMHPYKGFTDTYLSMFNLIKLTPRLMLQLLGTECGRQIIHPNIWVTSTFTDYKGDEEIWKDIEGYEGRYQISSFGRVKGLDREIVYGDKTKGEYHTKKESILKPTITGKYEMIKLEGNDSVTIHSLVAKHFVPTIVDKDYINHIDQNSLNNFYKNLEWCTQSENILDANRKGNGNIGERQSDSKLTDKDVEQIKVYLKTRQFKQTQIAKKFNVSTTTISDIKHERKWSHVGKDKLSVRPILPQPFPNWIITDCRFPNEAQAIKDRGGIIIKVMRDIEGRFPLLYKEWRETTYSDFYCFLREKYPAIYGKITHESEIALDNYADYDAVIDNGGFMPNTVGQVKIILKNHNIWMKENLLISN